jgi:hypothetical protein
VAVSAAPSKAAFWPTRTQELLLRAGISPSQRGLGAWQELGPRFDLTRLAPGSIGILPLVYRRLSHDAPGDPRLPRLKGIYRSTWVKNQLLSARLVEILDVFDAGGVEPILIGSLSAAMRYYPELALRPTPALELLVDVDSLKTACRALGRLGFAATGPLRLDGEQPIALNDADGQICVLRTEPAVGLRLSPISARAEVGRCSVRVIHPEHDLLIACAGGARTKPIRSIQWLVDIARIVDAHSNDLDWERLLADATAYAQVLRLRETFRYLSSVLEVMIPNDASESLDALSIGRRERLAYRFAGTRTGALGSLPQAVGEHLAQTRGASAVATVSAFPGFLRKRWNLNHGWQLPLAAARRVSGVLRSAAGKPRNGDADRAFV